MINDPSRLIALGFHYVSEEQYPQAVYCFQAAVDADSVYVREFFLNKTPLAIAKLRSLYPALSTFIDEISKTPKLSTYTKWKEKLFADASLAINKVFPLIPIPIKIAYDYAAIITTELFIPGFTFAKNDPEALYQLGKAYWERQNYWAALACFEAAAEKNHALSIYALGSSYIDGVGIFQRDYEEAMNYLEVAKNLGNVTATNDLGVVCFKKGNFVQSIEYFEAAAKKNHSIALYNLGLIYLHGYGVDIDTDEACHYFQRAYALGVDDALTHIHTLGSNAYADIPGFKEAVKPQQLFELGKNYYNTDNKIDGLTCIKAAIKQNYIPALYFMAKIYETDITTEESYKKVRTYYKKIVDLLALAPYLLDLELFKSVREHFELAICEGSAEALYYVGLIHYHGFAVREDKAVAADYWEEAVARGYTNDFIETTLLRLANESTILQLSLLEIYMSQSELNKANGQIKKARNYIKKILENPNSTNQTIFYVNGIEALRAPSYEAAIIYFSKTSEDVAPKALLRIARIATFIPKEKVDLRYKIAFTAAVEADSLAKRQAVLYDLKKLIQKDNNNLNLVKLFVELNLKEAEIQALAENNKIAEFYFRNTLGYVADIRRSHNEVRHNFLYHYAKFLLEQKYYERAIGLFTSLAAEDYVEAKKEIAFAALDGLLIPALEITASLNKIMQALQLAMLESNRSVIHDIISKLTVFQVNHTDRTNEINELLYPVLEAFSKDVDSLEILLLTDYFKTNGNDAQRAYAIELLKPKVEVNKANGHPVDPVNVPKSKSTFKSNIKLLFTRSEKPVETELTQVKIHELK